MKFRKTIPSRLSHGPVAHKIGAAFRNRVETPLGIALFFLSAAYLF